MTQSFVQWRDAVVSSLATRDDVVGVAGLGSTAATSRADAYSDLDLFIIVSAGAEDRYRRLVDWLPDADKVVLHLTEWHGGGKVLFSDGRMIEWGVGTPEAVSTWLAGEGTVLFDRPSGAAGAALESAKAIPFPINDIGTEDALATFVFAIHHGMGRVRRGELLSGGEIIRSEATSALIRAARAGVETDTPEAMDRLDIRRRLEITHPELASDLARALEGEPEQCARELIGTAERHFAGRLSTAGLDAVRRRYLWVD